MFHSADFAIQILRPSYGPDAGDAAGADDTAYSFGLDDSG
jgi:hypothetical protein